MGLCASLLYRVRSVLAIAVFFPTTDANLFWGNLAVKSQASVNLLWKLEEFMMLCSKNVCMFSGQKL